jgi:tetratricopeptide (TPR) repeat protein
MKKSIPAKKHTNTTTVTTQTVASLKKVMLIICAAFAMLLYANTITHEYTVDDDTVINNNKITKKGISALPEIFTTAYRAGFWERKESLYRPLSVAMFAVEYSIAPGNPVIGHLINILLYAATACLLLLVLLKLLKNYNQLLPFAITLLFIAHPLHTEVVANIKSRDELLCFFFCMLSIWYLLLYIDKQKTMALAGCIVSFFMALISKENALTFVAVAPLFVFFFTNVANKQVWQVAGIYLLVAVGYLALRIAILGGATNFTEIQLINNSLVGAGDNVAMRLATSIYIMGKYLWLLLFPHPLSFDYSFNTFPLVSFGDVRTLFVLIVIAALIFYVIKNFIKRNPIAFGILFFAATISLVSNVLFLIEATLGERFAYMPSLGYCITLPFVLALFIKTTMQPQSYQSVQQMFSQNKNIALTLVVILCLFSVKTVSRNFDWKSNFTLLTTDVKTNTESARIHYALGSEYVLARALKADSLNEAQKAIDLDSGIVHLERGVQILDSYSDAWYHLALAYKEKSDHTNAIRCFEKARTLKQFKEIDFFVAAGISYGENKMYDKSFADFNTAISIDSTSNEAYNNLGMYQTNAGLLNEAVVSLNKSINLKTNNKNARYNLGNVYAKAGDYVTAIKHYQQAIQIDPTYGDAYNNMGNSYAALKDYKNALVNYQKLLELQPANAKVTHNIGVTYMILGDSINGKNYMARAQQMQQ